MGRYRLQIEYDGAPFHGWQRQDDVRSVQGAIEDALKALGEEDALVQGAGRTDAGVHALGQVAHVDLERPWAGFRLAEALNAHLRQGGFPVAILDVDQTDAEFHARFHATYRRYIYRIVSRRAPLTVEKGRAWNVKVPLDLDAMNEAAKTLIGEHDFTTFRSTECQAKSPVKTLDILLGTRESGNYGEAIIIRAEARSFLHNQVRSLVGSLKLVGEGKWNADVLRRVLQARDRRECAPVAPAHGLYLHSVDY